MLRPYWGSKKDKSFTFTPYLQAYYLDEAVSPTGKHLFNGLLALCVDSPSVTKSIPSLIGLTKMSRCTVIKAINEIEKRGWIETKRPPKAMITFTIVNPRLIYNERELYSSKPLYDSMAPKIWSEKQTSWSEKQTSSPPNLVCFSDTYKDGGVKDEVLRYRGPLRGPDCEHSGQPPGPEKPADQTSEESNEGIASMRGEPPNPLSAQFLNSEGDMSGRGKDESDVGENDVAPDGNSDKVEHELSPAQKLARQRRQDAIEAQQRATVKCSEAQADVNKRRAERDQRKAKAGLTDMERRQLEDKAAAEAEREPREPVAADMAAAFRGGFAKHRGYEYPKRVAVTELAGWKRSLVLYGAEAVEGTIEYVLSQWETVGARFGKASEPVDSLFYTDFIMSAMVAEFKRGAAPKMISRYEQERNNSRMKGEASNFAESRRRAADPNVGWGKK